MAELCVMIFRVYDARLDCRAGYYMTWPDHPLLRPHCRILLPRILRLLVLKQRLGDLHLLTGTLFRVL